MDSSDYKISFAQRRLWLINQFENVGSAYNIHFQYSLEDLQPDLVQKAFRYVVDRHEILRTTFDEINGEPRQIIHDPEQFDFKVNYMNLSHEADSMRRALEIGNQETNHHFDLVSEPLIRVTLVKLDQRNYGIVVVIHHIIFDGWSMGILLAELEQVYGALATGQQPGLGKLDFQYKDYTLKQHEEFESGKYQQAREYWHEQLAKQQPPSQKLIQDLGPIPAKNFNGKSAQLKISQQDYALLKAFSLKNKSTLLISLISMLKVVFYRYTGLKDLIIGTVVSGRDNIKFENQLGFYVNTVPIRTRFTDKEPLTFQQFFELVKDSVLSAYQYDYYPFDMLVDELKLKGNRNQNPVFDIMVTMNMGNVSDQVAESQLTDEESEIQFVGDAVSKFDLTATFSENENNLYLNLAFDPNIYPASFIEQILGHFNSTVHEFLKDPGQSIDTFDMLAKEQRSEFLNYQSHKLPDESVSLMDLFEEVVSAHPDSIAIVDEEQELTYSELNRRANIVAHLLRQKYSCEAGDIIAINCNQSAAFVIFMLAAVKLGCVYLPMDKTTPEKRVDYMLKKASCRLIITDQQSPENQEEAIVLKVADLIQQIATHEGSVAHEHVRGPNAYTYLIFTSGSTGNPKGVVVAEPSLINLVKWYQDMFSLSADTRNTMFSSISFDAHVMELWPVLLAGGATHILSDELRASPAKLSEYTHSHQIDQMYLPTAFYHQFRNEKLIEDGGIIVTGGEKLKHRGSGNWKLFNTYGPTETTVAVTAMEVPKNATKFPIGIPAYNTKIYLLDACSNKVPQWAVGEMYIGGTALSKGYYNDAELTDKAFVPNPFEPGELMYKTGDRAFWDENGLLNFVGRIGDGQIKLRGYRIELKEIEQVILGLEGIELAVVKFVDEEGSEPYIIAFYKGALEVEAITRELAKTLPHYMIPSHFVRKAHFPKTISGKVDGKKLMEQFKSVNLKPRVETKRVAGTEMEKYLDQLWQEIFDKDDSIDIGQNFFLLGGNSLTAMRLVNRIYKDIKKTVYVREIFDYPTIMELANAIEAKEVDNKFGDRLQGLSDIQSDLPFLVCVPPVLGSSAVFMELAKTFNGTANVFGFDYPGIRFEEDLPDSIHGIAELLANEVAQYLTGAPIIIMGYSLGVCISFEAAKILDKKGVDYSLILMDRSPERVADEVRSSVMNDPVKLEAHFQKEYANMLNDVEGEQHDQLIKVLKHNFYLGMEYNEVEGQIKADITAIQAEGSMQWNMMLWKKYTSGFFSYNMVDGDHYQVLSKTNLPLIKRVASQILMTANTV